MSKEKLVFIFLLVFAINLQAQEAYLPGINDTVKVRARKGVKEYYQLVHKAENKIIEGNYIKASKLYSKAFKQKFPFYKDARNALVAEYKEGFNPKRSLSYMIFLRKVSELNTDEFITELKTTFSSDSSNIIFNGLKEILDTVKVTLDLDLIQKFKELRARDQDMRGKAYKEYPQKPYESPYLDTIQYQDSLNMAELVNLYKKHKELPENIIGKEGRQTIGLIISHNSAWYNLNWFPDLKCEVYRGNFDNKTYSRRVDAYLNHISIRDSLKLENEKYNAEGGIAFFNKFMIPYFNDSTSKKINIKRAKIFLEPYEEVEKKKLWSWQTIGFLGKDTDFNIGIYNSFGTPQEMCNNKEEARNNYNFQEMIIKNISNKKKEAGFEVKIYEKKLEYDFDIK